MHLRERLETCIIVTLISALIWLYAEAENVKTYNEPVTVSLVAAPGKSLEVSPSEPFRVVLGYKGSTGQHQAIGELLAKTWTIEVGGSATDQVMDEVIILKDHFEKLQSFSELGIEILSCEPATATATIDPVRTVPVRVTTPPTTGSFALASSVTVEPREIETQLPASQVARAEASVIVPDIKNVDLSQYEVNAPHSVTVPIIVPTSLTRARAKLAQESVELRFTIRKMTDSYAPPFIPIQVNVQPRLLKQYTIDLPEDQLVVRDVTLSGAADVIAKLKDGELSLWAEIRPTADQLAVRAENPEKATEPIQLHINVPAGVNIDTVLPSVTINVTAKE